ncbi:leptin receptor isoform X3 [Mobula hypostoma]|uniref:leptin receptor isoform X3 n=1 Tax=Mobula hypostoma TaxID=723540 RepID=UPI002FC3BAC4
MALAVLLAISSKTGARLMISLELQPPHRRGKLSSRSAPVVRFLAFAVGGKGAGPRFSAFACGIQGSLQLRNDVTGTCDCNLVPGNAKKCRMRCSKTSKVYEHCGFQLPGSSTVHYGHPFRTMLPVWHGCSGASVLVNAHDPEKAFEIPPWNFTMFCTLQKHGATEKHRSWQTQLYRNSSCLHSSLSEYMRIANTSRSTDQDGFSCCLWKEADAHCPAQFIKQEKSIRIDIKCWATEDLTLFVCTLDPEGWKMSKFAKYRMKHQNQLLFDQKESNTSTYSSSCVEQQVIQCTIPSPDLNHKYFIWIELITNSGTLQSPLMFVMPINVVKVNPPQNLQTEMTVEGIFNLSWSSPNPEPYLLQFEVKYSTGNPERVWKVKDIWQNSLILHNLESGQTYRIVIRCKRRSGPGFWSDWSDPLQVNVQDSKINISCQTDGALETMICRWHTNIWKPEAVGDYKLKYYMKESWCDNSQVESNSIDVEECTVQKNEFGHCLIKPINVTFGHVMWVEFSLQEVAFKSEPTCVIPMDMVKPWAPSNVDAEMTLNGSYLNISWEKPLLPPYTLLFEIQYSEDGIESNWKTLFAVNETFIITEVADPCAIYVVRVRCMRFEGPGYQSEWSSLVNTNLADIQEPTTGPDFWRFIDSDPLTKQSNITLMWKPLTKSEAMCTVKDYTLKYQSKENITWLKRVGDVTSYSFPLTNEIKSVSVIAINSIGSSRRNFKLILSKDNSKAETVLHSLHASVINNSCVAVSWRVLPLNCQPTSFVIEWKSLANNRVKNLKWIRASENLTSVYIHDHFYPSVQYQLTIYPIFSEKEGQPSSLYMKIKNEGEVTRANNDGMQNVILPLVFLSSVLLIGIFLISKQRIRSLVWKEVPNPNKCSWAQGINFKKPDAAANVFGKYSQGVLPVSPQLVESEIFAAAIIEEIIQFKEDKSVIAVDSGSEVVMKQNANSSDIQGLSESNNIDSKIEDNVETTCAQSKSEYSKIMIDVEMDPLCTKQKCVSSYSDEGVYSGNETDSSSNESNNLWEFQKHTLMQLIQFDEANSSSIISSEGFSESHEQESKVFFNGNDEGVDFCYLEQTSFEDVANSNIEGHTVQELPLLEKCLSLDFQNPSEIYSISYLNSLLKFSLNGDHPPQRALRSYMPQFQTDF